MKNTFEIFDDILEKAVKNNLVKKLITNKLGHKQTVWVSPEDAVKLDKHDAAKKEISEAGGRPEVDKVLQKHNIGSLTTKFKDVVFLPHEDYKGQIPRLQDNLSGVKRQLNDYLSHHERHGMQTHDEPAKVGYEKSGQRHTEHSGFKQGDTVELEVGGKKMKGEFKHVNTNVHSPKGYAVIRGEDGKLYERTVNKITKIDTKSLSSGTIDTKPAKSTTEKESSAETKLPVEESKPEKSDEDVVPKADTPIEFESGKLFYQNAVRAANATYDPKKQKSAIDLYQKFMDKNKEFANSPKQENINPKADLSDTKKVDQILQDLKAVGYNQLNFNKLVEKHNLGTVKKNDEGVWETNYHDVDNKGNDNNTKLFQHVSSLESKLFAKRVEATSPEHKKEFVERQLGSSPTYLAALVQQNKNGDFTVRKKFQDTFKPITGSAGLLNNYLLGEVKYEDLQKPVTHIGVEQLTPNRIKTTFKIGDDTYIHNVNKSSHAGIEHETRLLKNGEPIHEDTHTRFYNGESNEEVAAHDLKNALGDKLQKHQLDTIIDKVHSAA